MVLDTSLEPRKLGEELETKENTFWDTNVHKHLPSTLEDVNPTKKRPRRRNRSKSGSSKLAAKRIQKKPKERNPHQHRTHKKHNQRK